MMQAEVPNAEKIKSGESEGGEEEEEKEKELKPASLDLVSDVAEAQNETHNQIRSKYKVNTELRARRYHNSGTGQRLRICLAFS